MYANKSSQVVKGTKYTYEKHLNHFINMKNDILSDMNALDLDDKHYQRKKEDLEKRLYDIYDSIDECESLLEEVMAKRESIVEQKISIDNVYKTLIYYDKLVDEMDEKERRTIVEHLINKIEIYPEKQANGQWLKSIEFKLPIIENDMEMFLDKGSRVETGCILSKLHEAKHHVNV